MTLAHFQQLSPRAQLLVVVLEGTYLAQRWETEGGVNLYHLADESRGFFVEVGIEEEADALVVLRSFCSSGPLEDYTHYVPLPEA
jgi:hypothetical protein